MNLPKDVWNDLLVLESLGEASPETRRLIAAHETEDPTFAARVADARSASRSERVAADAVERPLPELELKTLQAARRRLRWRQWLCGGAIAATLLPFAFVGGDEGLRYIVLRDAPELAVGLFVAALILWFAWWRAGRSTGVSGLG